MYKSQPFFVAFELIPDLKFPFYVVLRLIVLVIVVFELHVDLIQLHVGLCINFIAYLWPSLLQIPEFIGFMNTPILKATKVNKSISFYTMGDYEKWKDSNKSASGYKIKYYKGLGTSTSKEFKEYFKEKKIVI